MKTPAGPVKWPICVGSNEVTADIALVAAGDRQHRQIN
jgi:hypothetical protein